MMAPPSQILPRGAGYDEGDVDGIVTQTPQFPGAGNNVGKLLQTQSTADEGECVDFPGWDLYFPTTAFDESSPAVATVKNFIKYFQTWSGQYTANVERVLKEKFVEIYYRYNLYMDL